MTVGLEQFPKNEKREGDSAQSRQREVFDPAQGLQEIRSLPKNERQAKIENFKERYVEQREGLARMQAELTESLRKNPDMDEVVALDIVQRFADQYGFSEQQLETIRAILGRYREKHEAVSRIRKEHPDDEELYTALFGEKPKGKVWVSEGPISLYFSCENPGDFMHLYLALSGEGRPSFVNRLRTRFTTRALAASDAPDRLPELAGTIAFENSKLVKPRDIVGIRKHEEQHIMNHLFEDTAAEAAYLGALAGKEGNVLGITADYYRKKMEEDLKDEIIAFSQQGMSAEDITKIMRDSYIPHYVSRMKEEVFPEDSNKLRVLLEKQGKDEADIGKQLAQYEAAMEDAQRLMKTPEYQVRLFSLLAENIVNYQKIISERGEEGFALAINTPIGSWKSLLRRLQEKQLEQK